MSELTKTIIRNAKQLIDRNLAGDLIQYLRSIDQALSVNSISLYEYELIQQSIKNYRK